MIRANSKNFRLIAHRLMISAVVFGLFFSSGEGIRLMPFPDAAPSAELSGTLKSAGEIPAYSDSVLKFGQSVTIAKTSAGRDGIRQILFDPVAAVRKAETADHEIPSHAVVNGPINQFTAPSLTDCRSDRAPPQLS